MKITREYLQQFDPCSDRWNNYLKHYSDWSGTLLEFLELENISIGDKFWLAFKDIPELEKLQREFAILCAARAVDICNVVELQEYFNLILLGHAENILQEIKTTAEYWAVDSAADRAAYRPADWAAYRAADWAAYWAAYRAADWAAYRAADGAADWAAERAADRAADWAAEREIQLNMLQNLAEELVR